MIAKKLIKISDIINNNLFPINRNIMLIKIINNNILIVNAIKLQKNQNKQNIYNTLKDNLNKHSNFINSPIPFEISENNKPLIYHDLCYCFGWYKCQYISDDDFKKIIAQWQSFGYKLKDFKEQNFIKTTQNSVY